MNKILVTGAAGFIGFHLTQLLLNDSANYLIGIDNLNNYYDVNLKLARLAQLQTKNSFNFIKADISDKNLMSEIFKSEKFDYVINLAAQAGVRYSLKNPYAYIDSNITGFMNIIEGCRNNGIKHLVYASSSSVYGGNTQMPFSVSHNVDHPISLYAATKKANELMAHTYSHLFKIPMTGLRFFTVYGPWGRPDMSLFIFTKAIIDNKPIEIYNNGNMLRDFTYIADIVEGIKRIIYKIPAANSEWNSFSPDPSISSAPYRLFNIGNNNPVELMHFIEIIEKKLNKKAEKIFLPMQPGDVPATYADIESLEKYIGFKPATPIETGIEYFVEWFEKYYKLNENIQKS